MQYKNISIFILVTIFFLFPMLLSETKFTVSAQNVRQDDEATKLFKEGCMLIQQKKYAEAAKVFERVAELSPEKRGTYTNLSWMYLELGRYDDAAATARKEIVNYPASSMAHNNLGFALTQLGKYEEAILELQKAVALDVNNSPYAER